MNLIYQGDEITATVVWKAANGSPVDASTVFRFESPDGTVTQQDGSLTGAGTGTYTATKTVDKNGVWKVWAICSGLASKTEEANLTVESGAPAVT